MPISTPCRLPYTDQTPVQAVQCLYSTVGRGWDYPGAATVGDWTTVLVLSVLAALSCFIALAVSEAR